MKIQSVTMYRPDSKGYLEIGKNLVNEDGTESAVKVEGITILFGIITIKFSNGDKVVYGKFPYIATKK